MGDIDEMNLALVSTWRQSCGIATYTENLAAALRDLGHNVLILAERTDSERQDAQANLDGIEVVRCWSRHETRAHDALLYILQHERPDVVHVQHEFGLFPNPGPAMKLLLDMRRSPLVLTPHTITPRSNAPNAWFWSRLKSGRVPLVCHTPSGIDCLADEYLYPRSWLRHIPHACPPARPRMDRDIARARLDLPTDRTVLATLGFIGVGKRQDFTLTAINDALDNGLIDEDEFMFVIAGAAGGGWDESGRYVEALRRAIESFGLSGCCQLREGFVPFDQMDAWFGAADFMVNCSVETQHSASGRIRLPAAYGCPQILEMVNIHRDFDGLTETFAAGDLLGLMKAIRRMIRDSEHRDRLGAIAKGYAEATSWPIVAQQHVELYEEIAR